MALVLRGRRIHCDGDSQCQRVAGFESPCPPLLEEAGAKARRNLSLRDEQLYQGLRGLFTRVRAEKADWTTAALNPIHKRLDELEAVLAKMLLADWNSAGGS